MGSIAERLRNTGRIWVKMQRGAWHVRSKDTASHSFPAPQCLGGFDEENVKDRTATNSKKYQSIPL